NSDSANILANRAAIARRMMSGFGAGEVSMGMPFELNLPKFEELAEYDVAYLAYSLQTGEEELYLGYVRWLHSMLAGHGLPGEVIVPMALANLNRSVREVVTLQNPGLVDALFEAARTVPAGAAAHPETFLRPEGALASLAAEYLDRIVHSDRRGALDLVRQAIERKVEIAELYLNVFEPVQREVGRLWQMQKISVAHEHFASGTTQMAMSMLYEQIFKNDARRTGCAMVAACVGDELHEIGLRMVADLFEMSGWDTVFLGASAPMQAIATMLRETGANLLALSCSMIVHVENIRRTIEFLRENGFADLTILVGGFPFNLSPQLAGIVGATGYAPDARTAIVEARRFCPG
ncbi:cobalamin-dependent protein, partial [Myxococcota bacterium]|nr:cobalamin-dependent protein [Myxococcota bacterium]